MSRTRVSKPATMDTDGSERACDDADCQSALCRLQRVEQALVVLARAVDCQRVVVSKEAAKTKGKVRRLRDTLARYKVMVREHRAHLMHAARGPLGRFPKGWTDADKEVLGECLLPVMNGVLEHMNARAASGFEKIREDLESGVLQLATSGESV